MTPSEYSERKESVVALVVQRGRGHVVDAAPLRTPKAGPARERRRLRTRGLKRGPGRDSVESALA